MQPDAPTPEERAEQLANWRKELNKAKALLRTGRVKRKPPATKAGMHRKRPT